MSAHDEQLKALQTQLDALKQQQTQDDYDEGARLHAEKNAPWVNGMYSHLKFPAYHYQDYPKAMYSVLYAQARGELDAAMALLVAGTDMTRDLAIKAATMAVDRTLCQVADADAERLRYGQGWRVTQADAKALKIAQEQEIAVQAAHLNYEDRNLTGPALTERERADDLSDGHLVDVTGTLAKAGRTPRVKVA